MPRPTGSSAKSIAIALGLTILTCLLWAGCSGTATGPTAQGAKMLLNVEPEDASGVLELKANMITGLASADSESVIVGRVVSGQSWETDQATFLVSDLQTDSEHSHDHGEGDHSDCAFCQAKEKETGSMALVRVVNSEGEAIGTDARKLLGIEESQVIVAQGSGSLDEDGTLVFVASKIFIRK